jgi:hypothetical protein
MPRGFGRSLESIDRQLQKIVELYTKEIIDEAYLRAMTPDCVPIAVGACGAATPGTARPM